MHLRLIALAVAIGSTALGTAASAQQLPMAPAYAQPPLRGNQGSDRNLRTEMRRLEQVIDMLKQDRHDYGGHREQAVDLLQRARQQLEEGLEYDRTHGPG